MNNNDSLTFTGRVRSLRYACVGVWTMISSQHNAWIHAAVTVMVVTAGLYYGLTAAEWCWIILTVVAVWTAGALNTAFEFLTDVAAPQFHPVAKKAKDVAAGAVLLPLVIALVLYVLLTTWRTGRQIVTRNRVEEEGPLLDFVRP